MEKIFHLTEDKYLESILNNGLLPQQGIRSNLIEDSKRAVFYSQGYEGVIAMFFMMLERYDEYRSSEGDIHIESRNIIREMVEDRKAEGREVGQYLRDRLEAEERVVEVINYVRMTDTYKDFLGEGVCLSLTNVDESDEVGQSFYNSWTNSSVDPRDISVVVLEDRSTGDLLSSKYDVVDYFMGLVSLGEMRDILYDNDIDDDKRNGHFLWQIMSKYYEDNQDRISELSERYRLREMPIAEYCSRKSFVK